MGAITRVRRLFFQHLFVQHLFVVVTVLTCAAAPAFAREKALPKSKPAAAPPTAPAQLSPAAAASATERKHGPVVPMEEFAAESDPSTTSRVADSKPEEPSACYTRIADRIAVIQSLAELAGPGDCGATDVVKLEAVIMPDKSRVTLTPPATLRCTMAEVVATWVREDLTASVAALGSAIRNLDNYASYDCRGRNRIAGAKISEHGMANAIDVRGIHLANGKFAGFTDRNFAFDFRETVRKQTCARFTTVLGPGSDGHHETHIHVDLAERRGGYRLCQWNVLAAVDEVPLPRPRPQEAP
ncbi:hypothetical protein DFP91_5222 [Pseudorhodoplanes sinuspersici]|nr:hypothetical protein DFP91_5222 [Pseudorhodoplanes sinuspersici]